MARVSKPRAVRGARARATPAAVSIGPVPEWKHLGLPDLARKARLLIVPSQDTDCVSIVNLPQLSVLHTVKLKAGSAPWHAKVTPDERYAYVSLSRFKDHVDKTSREDSTVSVIDIRRRAIVGNVKVGGGPVRIEMDARRRRAYVTNRFSNSVSVIDLKGRKNIGTVQVGPSPFWIRLNPKGDLLVVANFEDGTLSLIDPQKLEVQTTVKVGFPKDEPFPEFGRGDTLGFSINRNNIAFVANWRSHQIVVVDLNAARRGSRRAVVSRNKSVRFPFDPELDERNGLLAVGSYEGPRNRRLTVFDVKPTTRSLRKPIVDMELDGRLVPITNTRAGAVNYWMHEPFESRIIGIMPRGLINPMDIVVAIL